jgi:hypothetical protein
MAKLNETIGSMAAAARSHRRCNNVKPLPLRYSLALRIYERNVAEHPEVARMSYRDARDCGI